METVNSSPPLLPFPGKVRLARLIGRRLRFLMDLEDGLGAFTAHTNNTGSMLGLLRPGCEVLLSVSCSPGRKHPCTVEAVRPDGFWVGVNTGVPTRLLRAAWAAGVLPECAGYTAFATEPRFEGGRLDALLTGKASGMPGAAASAGLDGRALSSDAGELYVETKNVTLVEDCVAQFPDAPSERARKHMVELMRLARQGIRAALFFAVQRPDGQCFGPAEAVDPEYAALFREALAAGVEVWPYVVEVTPEGYGLGRRLPLARGLSGP
jgi:sugar fermentation stimulation protein A